MAITRLKQAGNLDAERLTEIPTVQLAEQIRPSGFFRVKAGRIKHFVAAYLQGGGHQTLCTLDTDTLRQRLLDVKGIGPETADDMLLYAFDRPVFVIDAYTRRLLSGLCLITGSEPYEVLRTAIEQSLNGHTEIYGEYHALIVRHAKTPCTLAHDCPHCQVEQRRTAARQL